MRGLGDGFGVVGVQGDGVFAGFEVDFDVPNEDAAGAGSGDGDEVGSGRELGGDDGFASRVDGGAANEVGCHGGVGRLAVGWWAACDGEGFHGFAGGCAGRYRRADFAQDIVVAVLHEEDVSSDEGICSGWECGGDEEAGAADGSG